VSGGQTHHLPSPFSCWRRRTIEQEGTYPLPEGSRPLHVRAAGGLSVSGRRGGIVTATTGDLSATVRAALTAEDVLAMQHLVRRIPVRRRW